MVVASVKVEVPSEHAGVRLDKLLVLLIPGLGRAGAKRLFSEGRVRVLGGEGRSPRRAAKGDLGAAGQVLEVDLDADDTGASQAVAEPEAPLVIVLETSDLVVVDKPAGQPTAPLSPGERGTVANALLGRYPEMKDCGFSPREPGLCHRLDTDTSGLLLAARTPEAFETLTRALKAGELDKRYLLVTSAVDLPETGTIEIPLAPHPKDRRRAYPCVHPRDVARYAPRPATTRYEVIAADGTWALCEASAPRALRHQIRAHFAAIGHPLAGDALYGGPEVPGLRRQALHASSITWRGDARIPAFSCRSPLPADLAAIAPAVTSAPS